MLILSYLHPSLNSDSSKVMAQNSSEDESSLEKINTETIQNRQKTLKTQQGDIQKVDKHMKSSTSHVIRELQIKTTVK